MTRFLPLTAIALMLQTVPAHADWLHWRGPAQNGVSADTGLPSEWSPKQPGKNNLIWKQPYGCRSTPVVCKGKVYIIGDAEESQINEQERVACFDAKTGKVLWEHRFNVFHTDIVSDRVGWANLAGDEETGNIYAHGVQGLFFCFSPDGKVLWSKSLTEEFGRITGYGGRVTSPIVDGDLVIIHMLNSSWGDQGMGGHRFLAMDKKTGEPRWWGQAGGRPLDTIYSVPVVAEIGGQRLLICGGADGGIHALKVNTGQPVWSYMISKRGLNVSPVVDEKRGWVYIAQSEENLDATEQGSVLCLDAMKITERRPALVWRKTGILSGYASPVLHDGRLYVCDNGAKMFCLSAENGEEIWAHKYGRNNTKGSPVWADGKIYIGVGPTFCILKPGDKKCETLSIVKFTRPDGLVIEMNGCPAVVDGRIYFANSDELYCIGTDQGKAGTPVQASAAAKRPASDAPIANLQVVPADVVLAPGGSASFKIRGFDARGNFVKEVQATWSLPTTPPPPTAPKGTPPLPALQGEVTSDGKVTVAKNVPAQSGIVVATLKAGDHEITGKARVRVPPQLPIAQDFEKVPEGRIPGGWINVGGKFQVVVKDGNHVLKKLANNPNPLLARANAYIGMPDLADYTIEADLMGAAREEDTSTGKVIYLPDMGVINSRYSLALDGNKQHAFIRSWEAKRRLDKTIPFAWKAGEWYHFKLQVVQEGDKAVARGKVWPKGQPEPSAWTLEVEDPSPNRHGSPALYAYATGIPPEGNGVGAEIFFDNIKVIPNK